MFGMALIVPREDPDHPTIGHPATAARTCHALQLMAQQLQAFEAAFDGGEVGTRDAVDLGTGLIGIIRQHQQLTDLLEAEPKLPSVADEVQTIQMLDRVAPLIAAGAPRLRHHADTLIVADGLYRAAGTSGQSTDRKPIWHRRSRLNLQRL